MTFHQDISEAAAVAVPDSIYGEVVGAWIVRRDGSHITREDVRRWVAEGMNPQVIGLLLAENFCKDSFEHDSL